MDMPQTLAIKINELEISAMKEYINQKDYEMAEILTEWLLVNRYVNQPEYQYLRYHLVKVLLAESKTRIPITSTI